MAYNNSNQSQNNFEASSGIIPITLLHSNPIPVKPPIPLRPYQEECVESVKNYLSNGIYRLLCTLATGSGKTVIFAKLIKELGGRALVLVHTHELQVQAEEKIKMVTPDALVGFVNGNRKEFDAPIVVATVQSAMQPLNLLALQKQNFPVLVFDECHHAATDGAKELLKALGFGQSTQKKLIGFTATAFRNDDKGLGEVFDVVAYEKTITDLIKEDHLVCPTGFKVATNLDFSKVKTVDGDFQHASLSAVMDTLQMNELVVDTYILNAKDLKAICFTVNVQHAKNIAQSFNNRGISAAAVYGDMSILERESIICAYKSGEIRVLSNCAVLTEGFDEPSIECVIIARPTQSLGLYQQMVGRGLRKHLNKRECVVIDFNEMNHSICNVAMLLKDKESEVGEKYSQQSHTKIPKKLDPELKSALRSYNPISEDFLWQKMDGSNTYCLKGINETVLAIEQQYNGYHCVAIYKHQKESIVVQDLTFDYAFGTAEDFAKQNRNLFVFSDSKASWREDPISEDQCKFLKKLGCPARALRQLNKGQASYLIDYKKKMLKN